MSIEKTCIETGEFMINKQRSKVMTSLLVGALLFPTLAFGQTSERTDVAETSAAEAMTSSYSDYLIEITAGYNTGNDYLKESQAITRILASSTDKNPVLIDNQGYARDMVLQAVAARLADASHGKKLYRVNWNALFSSDKDQNQIDTALAGILKYAEVSKKKTAIYLDDIASFSFETPVLGAHVAAILYNALSQGKIQILSNSDADSFTRQIAGDSKLRSRFQRIDVVKDSGDGFVGDKLSPDLRALVNSGDQNKVVKVILQSNDISNPELVPCSNAMAF